MRPAVVIVGVVGLACAGAFVLSLPGCAHTPDAAWRAEVAAAAPSPPGLDAPLAPRTWRPLATLPPPTDFPSDLAGFGDGLLVAASVDPLGEDGAAIWRVGFDGSVTRALDWNGQGFLRVHVFGRRILVPDADAPFSIAGYLAAGLRIDEYLFVSDAEGRLAPDVRETLPDAYHAFDAARLADGRLVVSTGAYPPGARAYLDDAAPAVLFVDDGPGRPFRRAITWPAPDARGVFRFTYLQPLPDGTVLAGTEASRPGVPDAVRLDPRDGSVTPVLGIVGRTLRWAVSGGAVFHLAQVGVDDTQLTRSDDGGRTFVVIPWPSELPSPDALTASSDALLLVAGGRLVVSVDGRRFQPVSPREPALETSGFPSVGVALLVHGGRLFAANRAHGGPGRLFEAVSSPPDPSTAPPPP